MTPITNNFNDGQRYKNIYLETCRNILSQEMLMDQNAITHFSNVIKKLKFFHDIGQTPRSRTQGKNVGI